MTRKHDDSTKAAAAAAGRGETPPQLKEAGRSAVEFVYRYDPPDPAAEHPGSTSGSTPQRPSTPEQAVARLLDGNKVFADFMAACNREAVGQGGGAKGLQFVQYCDRLETGPGVHRQNPFAAVLGCIDARVPIELSLGQEFDNLMTIRTAGNTLNRSGEGMGSLHFALANYAPKPLDGDGSAPDPKRNIRLVLVLGHTDCGAVNGAFTAFAKQPPDDFYSGMPPALFTILWEISEAVKFVMEHKASIGEDDTTLKDAISFVNAAQTARAIRDILRTMAAEGRIDDRAIEVRFGMFDVKDHRLAGGELNEPPADDEALLRKVLAFVKREAELREEMAHDHPSA